MRKQWAILSQVLCSVGNYAELDAVQRVDVGRLQGDSSTLWLKVYSSPITKVWVVTFDGDEMNLHAPQSEEAAVELEEIAAIPHNIVTPRHAKPLIGVFQDTLVGSYRLTRPGNEFTRREFMNLMMTNKRFDGTIPAPAGPNSRFTGQQVLSQLLPPLNLEMGNKSFDSEKEDKSSNNFVKITQGNIEQGIIDTDVYMKPGKGIIHVTYNDYGPKDTVDLLDSLQTTVENYLVMSGFSIGISDLVADENTMKQITEVIQTRKREMEQLITQVHTDLFDNNTGKTNQQEFEDQAFGIMNRATDDAGKSAHDSLSTENRLMSMVKSGSKGDKINVAQMIACLGQQAIEGKRIAYGFTDRTLPHYKKYDDSAEARGFIESSFIRGLTPQEFFFHAMSGREGLIDTAVKSVTGDTPIVVLENGKTRCVPIGDWIDNQIDTATPGTVEHYVERDMELLHLTAPVYIPTSDEDGNVTWGEITAITRHDPGKELYEIKTLAGKSVIVTESKSLLIWNPATSKFEHTSTPEVRPGHYVPVTQQLAEPPIVTKAIQVADYLPKSEFIYGTDYNIAKEAVADAMAEREHIPSGWWKKNNGSLFTLPYDSKARFQRSLVRSETENIHDGCVYPFHATREHGRVPDVLELNKENGQFIGLFLAEGNADIPSGYVQITNNNATIRNFAKTWFENHGIKTSEDEKINHIGGRTTCVRGYSTVLARLLTALVGHTSYAKHVPAESFAAPDEFIVGLLDGYFSGDGTVSHNSVEVGSASVALIDGISMLATRIGIFGKVFQTTLASNNIGTEKIAPTHRFSIRAQWATIFANKVSLLDEDKNARLSAMRATETHCNFPAQNNVVLDRIVEINKVDVAKYPKVYDLTVPSTLNFGLANGLHVVDTADTGYIQRQLIKAMEDLVVQHDGTVRDAKMGIVQYYYGEDSIMATKVEGQSLPLGKLTHEDIRREFGMAGVDWAAVYEDGAMRSTDESAIRAYVDEIIADQKMLIEGVFMGNALDAGAVNAPVNLARMILNIKVRFGLTGESKTDLTPEYVLEGIAKIIEQTRSAHHRIWTALLRFHLAPHKLIVKERLTKDAFDMLCELIIVNHMRSWVQPGEQVGIVAAHSIGEPATQMTLNTFHQAGVASKSSVTRGVPRLRELLKITKNPKATSLTIYLKPEFRKSKDKAREVVQDLELTLLRNITRKIAIFWDPTDEATNIEEDRELIEFYRMYEAAIHEEQGTKAKSKWILRLELNRDEMFNNNISMADVAFVIRSQYADSSVIYNDYNSDKLVMRIRVNADDSRDRSTASDLDDYIALKKFMNKLLNSTVIRGVPGIKAVTFRKDTQQTELVNGKYEQVDQYILDTDGTNFIKVANHPAVDPTRLYTTNVHDIMEILGLEAARAILITEMKSLFDSVGVNYRHLGLLCDVMTRTGRLMSADRYGINKNDIGPIAKMSFEETSKITMKAALFGEVDPVTGVSANVMTGQPFRGGTAFSQIMLDEMMAARLSEGMGEAQEDEEQEEDADIGDLMEEGMRIVDPCSTTQFQMNISMPPTVEGLDEPDVEISILEGDD